MAMNCKQFKHTQRIEKKQQFSFNPAEVNYEHSHKEENLVKPEVRDISVKKIMIYFVVSILALSIFNYFFS